MLVTTQTLEEESLWALHITLLFIRIKEGYIKYHDLESYWQLMKSSKTCNNALIESLFT